MSAGEGNRQGGTDVSGGEKTATGAGQEPQRGEGGGDIGDEVRK